MKVQKKFFKISVVLFSFLAIIASTSLYETTTIEAIHSEIIGTRGPASVSAEPILKSTEILNINCEDFEEKEINVRALQVRLEGVVCQAGKNVSDITIHNQTTGKQATFFKRGRTQYTTDFIQLKRGKNQISLTTTLKDSTQVKKDLVLIQ